MKPQARRVLRHLQNAGASGVHSSELRADFIADPAKRICELRDLGYEIEARTERLNGGAQGRRYIFHGSGSAERPGISKGFAPSGLAEDESAGRRVSRAPSPPIAAGASNSPAPAAPSPGSVTLERKPTTKGHRYANQPPDGRPDWVLVLDYSDPERPDFRWERRAPAQMEAA